MGRDEEGKKKKGAEAGEARQIRYSQEKKGSRIKHRKSRVLFSKYSACPQDLGTVRQ
jgi:hypothetical protein